MKDESEAKSEPRRISSAVWVPALVAVLTAAITTGPSYFTGLKVGRSQLEQSALAGDWYCSFGCDGTGDTKISIENGRLLFVNDQHLRSYGDYRSAEKVTADVWTVQGLVVNDGRTILWNNGINWARK